MIARRRGDYVRNTGYITIRDSKVPLYRLFLGENFLFVIEELCTIELSCPESILNAKRKEVQGESTRGLITRKERAETILTIIKYRPEHHEWAISPCPSSLLTVWISVARLGELKGTQNVVSPPRYHQVL